jgi:hypothetical protein
VINYATHFSETETHHNDEQHVMEPSQIVEESINSIIGEDGRNWPGRKHNNSPKTNITNGRKLTTPNCVIKKLGHNHQETIPKCRSIQRE